MPIAPAAQELLSSLVKHRDKKTLAALAESQFASDDEVKAFKRLRSYVTRHGQFPNKLATKRLIGLDYSRTTEPLSFYYDNFVNRAKYNIMRTRSAAFMEALGERDVEAAELLLTSMQTSLRAMTAKIGSGVRTFKDVADQVFEEFEAAQMSGGMLGITTGWPEIDAIVGGYVKGDVVAWIARLGKGKTMLLLYQALKAAQAGKKVLFVSPEVPDVQLVRRMIGMLTGVNPRYIARGMLSTKVHRRMVETINGLDLPILFAAGDFKRTLPFVEAMVDEFEPDIAFVDAMYLLTPETKRPGSGSRREVISDVAEELKTNVAAKHDIPVVISAQFNRTAVKTKNDDAPQQQRTRRDPLAHLDVHKIGETDVIAQIASLVFVVELGDPPYAFTRRWIGIKKGREGDGGHWLIHYEFNPFNMSVVNDNRRSGPPALDDQAIDEDYSAEDGPEDEAEAA